MKITRRVIVIDAVDIDTESRFWAGLLSGTVTRFGARSRGRKRRATAQMIGFVMVWTGGVALVAAAAVRSAGSTGWTDVAAAARAWPLALSLFWCLLLGGLVLSVVGVLLRAAALGRELKLALDVRDHAGAAFRGGPLP